MQPGRRFVSARLENTRQTEVARLLGSLMVRGLKNEKIRKHFHRRRRRRGEAIRGPKDQSEEPETERVRSSRSLQPRLLVQATVPAFWGIVLVVQLRSIAERPDRDPTGGNPPAGRALHSTVSWAPTPAAFSATSLKYEMLVFVPGSLNLNYITKEETSRRK